MKQPRRNDNGVLAARKRRPNLSAWTREEIWRDAMSESKKEWKQLKKDKKMDTNMRRKTNNEKLNR